MEEATKRKSKQDKKKKREVYRKSSGLSNSPINYGSQWRGK